MPACILTGITVFRALLYFEVYPGTGEKKLNHDSAAMIAMKKRSRTLDCAETTLVQWNKTVFKPSNLVLRIFCSFFQRYLDVIPQSAKDKNFF